MALRTKRFSFQTYMAFIIRHPVWPLLLVAAITLWFSWHLPNLSFKTTVYDLIIEELPQARSYRDFIDIFGSDEIIRIVVKAEDVFDTATFAKVTQLSEAAGKIEGVRRILSLPEIKNQIDPRNEWKMDRFAQMLAPVDLFKRNLISADHQTTIITLVLTTGSDKAAVIAAVRELMNDGEGLQLYQIGMPLVSEALAKYTQQDFLRLTPITFVVIALLLLLLFRNPHALILPLVCVILAMIWTFGYMSLAGTAVSMLTIIVPVFLIAVGTAYCLHICSEYLTQAVTAPSAKEATRDTFSRIAFPVTLAVLTTVFGIGSLAANRIEAIQEFAKFACFGMVSLMVIVLTFLPSMLTLLPLPHFKNGPSKGLDHLIERLLNRIVTVNLNHQKPCLAILAIVSAICIVGLFFIRSETNPVSFLKSSTPASRNFHDIYQQMSGSFPINVAMTAPIEDYFETPSNVAEVARLQLYLDSLPGVDKTISFADYLKLVNYAYNRFDPAYYTLPEDPYEMRLLINNFKILLGNDMLQRFMTSDFRKANILLLTHISSSTQFLKTRKQILEHVAEDLERDLSWDVTGLGMVIAASSHLLTVGQVKSLAISLVLIFGIMVTLFLSAKVGLIAVVPNFFPILVNFGIMGLFGIPLSVATGLIASVAIGLAVDDTIHYLVRYNREFKKDLDKDRAMRATIMTVGRPIIYTTLTIGIGFSVLLFSHFQPTATFGLLMVITMISALVGDMILLPTLMMHVELVTAWDLLKMMPAVSTISPGMVHELNQPLNAIKVGNDVIKLLVKKGAPLPMMQLTAVTREIGRQVNRASQMIERFSEIGHLPGFEKKPLQINDPIHDTLALLEHQLKLDSIQVKVHLAGNLPPVMAHYNGLVQVFFNILTNAQEAIAARRVSDVLESNQRISLSSFEKNGQVVVSVEDTGIGVSEHNLDRIFEPFFTTKEKGQGKGLGLTICKEIVRDCGGRIEVTVPATQGTKVTLSFPAVLEMQNGV
jgi:uncharacterized protein